MDIIDIKFGNDYTDQRNLRCSVLTAIIAETITHKWHCN